MKNNNVFVGVCFFHYDSTGRQKSMLRFLSSSFERRTNIVVKLPIKTILFDHFKGYGIKVVDLHDC